MNYRKDILDMAIQTNNGHIATALSCIDIIDVIYNKVLTSDDKFILSKGHACLALYVVLQSKGFNPNIYAGHPDIDIKNGIECTTGSLGHGLPIGVGMAIAKKIKKEKGRIYVLMGDGECEEGTIWECLLIIKKYNLNNITVIIDNNGLQAIDNVRDILPVCDLFKELRLNTVYVNGHDKKEIEENIIPKHIQYSLSPIIVIANTIKGKGVSFMEDSVKWHSRLPCREELEIAYKELK